MNENQVDTVDDELLFETKLMLNLARERITRLQSMDRGELARKKYDIILGELYVTGKKLGRELLNLYTFIEGD